MLTIFFFCLFEMEPSEWFCVVFVQKRNKAAVVQLACETCAKHEDLLQLRRFHLENQTGPQGVAATAERGRGG